jgi:hypothetical protein
MSYFKKFTDLLGGITCFIASVFLVTRYMDFNALKPEDFIEDGLEVRSKLEQFLLIEQGKDHRQYIILILFFVLSIAASRLFKKLPAVSFLLSVLPLWQTLNMLHNNLLYEYKGLFVILAALHIAGAFYELVFFDRHDNKKRTFIAVSILGVLSSAACFGARKLCEFSEGFYARFMAGELIGKDMKFDQELKLFGFNVLIRGAEDEEKVLMTIMVLLLVGVVVGIVLRGVYFIDVILAALPFGYSIFCWHAGKLICAPMLIVVPVTVYFFARVALFIAGVGIKTKKDIRKS